MNINGSSDKDQVKCPKCDIQLHFIDDLGHHYCFDCEEYFDMAGNPAMIDSAELNRPVPEADEVEKDPIICQSCGDPAEEIEDEGRFYCYGCEEYVTSIDSSEEACTEAAPEAEAEVIAESEPEEEVEMPEETEISPEKPLATETIETEPEEPEKSAEKRVPEKGLTRRAKQKICVSCNSNLTFVKKYERWYCPNCRKYEPKEGARKDEKKCPGCSSEAEYIAQYERWYCRSCKQYLPKEVEKAEDKKKEKKAPDCTSCGKPTRWIGKYERHFCFDCKKYAPRDAVADAKLKSEPSKKSSKTVCNKCSQPAAWIEKYERYYCHPCKSYLPKSTTS